MNGNQRGQDLDCKVNNAEFRSQALIFEHKVIFIFFFQLL